MKIVMSAYPRQKSTALGVRGIGTSNGHGGRQPDATHQPMAEANSMPIPLLTRQNCNNPPRT
jgi:hypothetical protein